MEIFMAATMANIYKIILLLFVFCFIAEAQTPPSGYTTHYRLRKYAQGANPGADSLNANWTDIDNAVFSVASAAFQFSATGYSPIIDSGRITGGFGILPTQSGHVITLTADTGVGKLATRAYALTNFLLLGDARQGAYLSDTTKDVPKGDSTTGIRYATKKDTLNARNYSNSIYLKNADSASIRNYSNSLYLKNADSSTERTYSNSLYEPKFSPLISGSIPYSNGTTLTQNNSALFWNNSDSTLRTRRTYLSDNTFTDHQSYLTISRIDTTSHTGYNNGIWNFVLSRGDSGVTNQGAIGMYTEVREDTTGGVGTLSRKRGTAFGQVVNVAMYTENEPYLTTRDADLFIGSNVGSVRLTTAMYFGGSHHIATTAANTLGTQYRRLIEVDDSADTYFLMNGGANIGLDLSGTDWLGSNPRAIKTVSTVQSDLGTLTLGGATKDSVLSITGGINASGGFKTTGSATIGTTITTGGATSDSALTTSSTQGGHFGRGLKVDGNVNVVGNLATGAATADSEITTTNGVHIGRGLNVPTGKVIQSITTTTAGTNAIGLSTNTSANPTASDNALYSNFFGVNTTSANAQGFTGSITLEGLNASARHQGTANMVGLASIYADTRNTSSGTVNGTPTQGGAYGVNSRVLNLSTGSITNAFTYYASIQNSNASGVITNAYGLYIDNYVRTGTISHAYGIYQVEAADTNYLNGLTGIGDNTPAYQLTVGSGDKFGVNGSGVVAAVGGVVTKGNYGIGTVVIDSSRTAQSAAIAASTVYAVPATAGRYLVSWVATVTTAASTSSVLGGTNGFQIKYTDADDSVVKTVPGTIVAGINTNSTNSTATGTISGSYLVNAKASTNIQYQIDYTSVGVTAMQYNIHITIMAQ